MVETGTARTWWRKSSYSGGDNNCVEVAAGSAAISVRDTKRPHGEALRFSPAAWHAFTRDLRRPSVRSDSLRKRRGPRRRAPRNSKAA